MTDTNEKEKLEAREWIESLGFKLDTEGGIVAWYKSDMGYISPQYVSFFYAIYKQAIDHSEVAITDTDFIGKEEAYCKWYKCPNCSNSNISYGSNFCPDCGRKINWQLQSDQEKSA